MTTNYDPIAGIYDFTSRAIFGNALVNAQICLLKYIPAHSRVLIVGGGTGWILEEIAKIHSGLTIDYVESSMKMIALSKKKNGGRNQVNFIPLAAEQYTTANRYDVILTPFFFDNFKADKIQLLFTQLNALLNQKGIWLYADFVDNGRLWQKLFLKTMYLFFRITTHIETQELVEMDPFFDPGYHTISEVLHCHNFIRSVVYQKRSNQWMDLKVSYI